MPSGYMVRPQSISVSFLHAESPPTIRQGESVGHWKDGFKHCYTIACSALRISGRELILIGSAVGWAARSSVPLWAAILRIERH